MLHPAKRTRLHAKTTVKTTVDPVVVEVKPKVGLKGKMSFGRRKLKANGDNKCIDGCVCGLVRPFKLRRRKKPVRLAQHYILDKEKKYIVGCAVRASPKYAEIIGDLFSQLNDGAITCKFAAHDALVAMVARQ